MPSRCMEQGQAHRSEISAEAARDLGNPDSVELECRTRELALFNLAIDSKLRGCDLVGLRVHDVTRGTRVASRAIVMQKKTQRPVQFELTEQTRDAVAAWIAEAHLRPEQYLFPSRGSPGGAGWLTMIAFWLRAITPVSPTGAP